MSRRNFNRREQDEIVYEIEQKEKELIKLKVKQNNEGLSSPEYHTMTMLEKNLKRLRRM